ncbi:RNA polymerase sigma factor WhiG [Sporichthya polymorpha]|uniref:RNA polymerase sigma factor WhiG n=1 Tax=Sporichthya polymorpha TaxID=35751 RepID=UPI000376801B|nr:RNA polymerase sigma factor WhiG [Sporichthya polymorpha]
MSERTREPDAAAAADTLGPVPSVVVEHPTAGTVAHVPAQGRDGHPGPTDELPALWRRYREARDEATRERLILHYSPLVRHVAGRVAVGLPPNVDMGDCASYGMFGLIDAIEKYDPDRGVRFEPYAMSRIRGAILDELRALDWIPRSVRAKARSVERGYQALEARLHRSPTEAELAGELGISVEDLQQTFSQISVVNVLALDELLAATDEPGEMNFGDTLADLTADDPVAVFEDQETRALLLNAIAELTERERRVIHLYYVEGMTLAEVGEHVGVSESRVCQIHSKAMLALRTKLAGRR